MFNSVGEQDSYNGIVDCHDFSFIYTKLRDGNSSSAGLLATFRGSVSEFPTYISSFGSLYIRFKTDDSLVHDGFHAEYRIGIYEISETPNVFFPLF